jgi:hypothetical protein
MGWFLACFYYYRQGVWDEKGMIPTAQNELLLLLVDFSMDFLSKIDLVQK